MLKVPHLLLILLFSIVACATYRPSTEAVISQAMLRSHLNPPQRLGTCPIYIGNHSVLVAKIRRTTLQACKKFQYLTALVERATRKHIKNRQPLKSSGPDNMVNQ